MKKLILNPLVIALLSFVFLASCKNEKDSSNEVEVIEEVTTSEPVENDISSESSMNEDSMDDVSGESEMTEAETSEEVTPPAGYEEVVLTYSYTAMGKEIKGSKTISGTQDYVETAAKKFEDSIKKIDPEVKVVFE